MVREPVASAIGFPVKRKSTASVTWKFSLLPGGRFLPVLFAGEFRAVIEQFLSQFCRDDFVLRSREDPVQGDGQQGDGNEHHFVFSSSFSSFFFFFTDGCLARGARLVFFLPASREVSASPRNGIPRKAERNRKT